MKLFIFKPLTSFKLFNPGFSNIEMLEILERMNRIGIDVEYIHNDKLSICSMDIGDWHVGDYCSTALYRRVYWSDGLSSKNIDIGKMKTERCGLLSWHRIMLDDGLTWLDQIEKVVQNEKV